MINTRIWEDFWFESLDPSEKLFFIYLLTNPMTNIIGAYELSKRTMGRATGLDLLVIDEILLRFENAKKVYYIEGWVILANFIKHQNWKSPKIQVAINENLNSVPDKIKLRISIPYVYGTDTLPHLTELNLTKLKYNNRAEARPPIKEKKKVRETTDSISLQEEIKKMEEDKRRAINIIALYLEERNPQLDNYGQLQAAIKRHIRTAQVLEPFSDSQIMRGVEQAKRMTPEWTLETVHKMLTK